MDKKCSKFLTKNAKKEVRKMALSKDIKIAVLGCGGKMGRYYIDKLLCLGIPSKNILGIDTNIRKLKEVAIAYPKLIYANSHKHAESLNFKPEIAIIAVNSTEHFNEIVWCYETGIKKIFCEKPLVYHKNQLDRLRAYDNSQLYVAHLINFSGIVADLLNFINKHNLVIRQFHSFWGKNWPGEKRMMNGDAEEEMPHPLALALALANYNQTIQQVKVFACMSFVPHVQPEYQEQASCLKQGFPKTMNDSTIAQFLIKTDLITIPAHISSSLNYTFQIRRTDIGMHTQEDAAKNNDKPPNFKACLEFDVDGKDILHIISAKTNEIIHQSHYNGDKIQANLMAALRAYKCGDVDPRLIDFKKAAWMVELLQNAIHNSKLNR